MKKTISIILLSILIASSAQAAIISGILASAAQTAPAAPTGVSAAAGIQTVTVSWSAVTGATSYNIYWGTSTGVTKVSGTKIAGVTSPYAHTGRADGTPYYYIVTAVNSAGESVASSEVNATTASLLLGDDFNDNSFNATKWPVTTGTYAESSQTLILTSIAGGATSQVESSRTTYTKQDMTFENSLKWSALPSGANRLSGILINLWDSGNSWLGSTGIELETATSSALKYNRGGTVSDLSQAITTGTYYDIKVQLDFTNSRVHVFVGGVEKYNQPMSTALTGITLANISKVSWGWQINDQGGTTTLTTDWMTLYAGVW